MDYQAESLRSTIERLIPGSSVSVRCSSWSELRSDIPKHSYLRLDFGQVIGRDDATLWFGRSDSEVYSFRLTRPLLPLTSAERDFLKYFGVSIAPFELTSSLRANRSAMRVSTRMAYENILIARYLRHSRTAHTYWTHSILLAQLQSLTTQRYEGAACTSGLIFASDLGAFLKGHLKEFRYTPFESTIDVNDRFFESPSSYRYVEGKNAFYVVDNVRRAHGVVRLADPLAHSSAARANHEHVNSLTLPSAAHAWVGLAGDNGEVSVAVNDHVVLRWLRGHWQLVDKALIVAELASQGCSGALGRELLRHVLLCSERRKGTVVLIPSDDKVRPPVVGEIDRSELGRQLRSTVGGLSFESLAAHGAAFGILTSDGLSTISKDGTVLGSGEIIDSSESATTSTQGGGRTQAAVAASAFGLVIKVSEDGPISLFRDQMKLVTFEM